MQREILWCKQVGGYNASVTNNGSHHYTYDAEDRMIRSGSTTYIYDAEGRRVSASQYEYLYDLEDHAVTLLDKTTHSWVRGEVFAAGQHIATYANGTTYFAHTDHLGSERMRTDINGNPCQTTAHLPFGDNQTSTGDCNPSALSFTGDEHDTESNLEHTQFRQLNTLAGRWMTPDPYAGSADITNPQSLNRYAYVLNGPLTFSDPLGLEENGCAYDVCVIADDCGYDACVTASSGWGWADYLDFAFNNWLRNGGGTGHGGGGGGGPKPKPAQKPQPKSCINGSGSGGVGVGVGGNIDAGIGKVGVSGTVGAGVGVFHNKAGGLASGLSAGASAAGGAAAYAGSHIAGAPKQDSSTAFIFGAYAGVGPNVYVTNAASVQQLSGPFTTLSVNVGYSNANFGFQYSYGNGIWQLSITPPIISAGFGAAASVITTTTAATHTGCH